MAKSQNNLFKLIILILILVLAYSYSINYLHFGTDSVIKEIPKVETTKILFVGDIMLDRGVSWYADKNGKDRIFSGVKDLFQKYDIVVGNLEGTITNNESIARKNNKILRFTFDKSYSDVLKNAGFDILSLANNHATDFGTDGYNQTISNLSNVGILSFGSPRNDNNISNIIKLNNKNFCFIGYHDLYTHDETPVLSEIGKLDSECDSIIVFAHWGDEYKTKSNERQRNLAYKFIDQGVDLIIGSHPHVVQENEEYKGKRIFYSLGNFVFDQDFSYDTKHGIAVGVDFVNDKADFEIIPITIEEGRVSITNALELK